MYVWTHYPTNKMNSFWNGWICALAVMSLHQDYYGQEAYIALMRDHWIPSHISVPLACVFLVVFVGREIRERCKPKLKNK
jgi:hypothetical protein